MEITNSGCVILKQKEYDELVKKAKDNSPKEIIVKYSYNYYDGKYNGKYNGINITGDFNFSDKISNQIQRICWKIDNRCRSTVEHTKLKIEYDERISVYYWFKNLPWYKRLFFKIPE